MNNNRDGEVQIRRARINHVDFYEVNDHELTALESGSEANLELVFATFLFSIGIGAIFTINTAIFAERAVEFVAWIFATVGNIVAIFLFLKWYNSRKNVKAIAARIRQRMPTAAEDKQPMRSPAQRIELQDDPVPENDDAGLNAHENAQAKEG